MEASTDNLNLSDLDMEASMENLNVADLDMENVADLGMTEDDENHQIAQTIEETLGKKERLSPADVLVLGYLRENEPVFVELDDVRNKVSFFFFKFNVYMQLLWVMTDACPSFESFNGHHPKICHQP